ncbi:hypothetical protein [Mycobacterium phage Weirdo19]|uniref:Uncharacterized protein n=1 Tax=Mycobacterium phage Weirdo19 TaxID=2601610 RepID=A0A6M2YT18_9CAUD|nr:hypothetical protein KDJ11_gp74 [Mycobacterium phage Weirdo19]QEA10842.1 hypothetical protein [Mycobacterium phage Weirdo19]
MAPYTWRNRLADLWYDLCHPITTIERNLSHRYCQRFGLVLVPVDQYERLTWWTR